MINREHLHALTNPSTGRAVLTQTELLVLDTAQGKRRLRSILLPLSANEPGELFEHVRQAGVNEVWVMPSTTRSRTLTCAWLEQANAHWVVVVRPHPSEPTRPISVLLWPKGSERQHESRLTFIFPEHAGWDWVFADARSLLATVTYLDQTLARPLFDSPKIVAHQLLTELTNGSSTSPLPSSTRDLHALSRPDGTPIPIGECTRELSWKRPLTRVEQQQRYLHKFTHLSYNLEACLGVRLGTGSIQYSSHGRACDDLRPGIWRVQVERAGSLFDGKQLPGNLDTEWMSTPQVKCCRALGYHMQVQEGSYWSEAQTLLTPWASTLWRAVEHIQTHPSSYRHVQARTNATRTITRLAQLGVSILGEVQATGGWARPEWWVQVRGRSQALLFAHLANLVRKGAMPVLVDRDAFWIVSNDPNPQTVVPSAYPLDPFRFEGYPCTQGERRLTMFVPAPLEGTETSLLTAQRWRGYTVGYDVPLPLSREVRDAFRNVEQADRLVIVLDTLAAENFP